MAMLVEAPVNELIGGVTHQVRPRRTAFIFLGACAGRTVQPWKVDQRVTLAANKRLYKLFSKELCQAAAPSIAILSEFSEELFGAFIRSIEGQDSLSTE